MRKRLITILLVGVLTLVFTACGNTGTTTNTTETTTAAADITVYKNGYIYTSNANQEYVSAIAIQDGKFIYAGDDAGVAKYEEGLPKENIVDLEGSLVTAGFIEGHTHFSFMAAMRSLHYKDIPPAANESKETALAELKKMVETHPDYEQYAIGNFSQVFNITAKDIDEICADKPVCCVGMGLHCAYVNSAFLKAGNITKDTPDAVPEQSYYERDEDGNPTGKIIELTQTWNAFQQAIKIDNEKLHEAYLEMIDLYHSYGFTGVTEGGFLGLDEYQMLDALASLEAEGNLNLVICPATIWYGHTVTPIEEVEKRLLDEKEKYTSELIRPGTLKMWADGTIGAHSALMREPYDDVDTCGVRLNTVEDLTAAAMFCKENDLNIHYHAIGDKAIENVLTALEAVGETTGIKSLVHFQISTPDLIERASKINGLIINMTPTWATPFAHEEVDPVGARRDYYGLYKETKDAGITIDFGADSNGPEECWNPALIILVSMFRSPDEEGLFLKGEPFSFEEAVDAYTINVAKERRIDDEFGSIEVGKSADFVIWNVDKLTETLYNMALENEVEPTDSELVYADDVFFKGELIYSH